MAETLPKDTVILTAGCAKYRYNKLDLGDIGGIPRILDAGQCNDSYSLALIALKLKEVFVLLYKENILRAICKTSINSVHCYIRDNKELIFE